MKLTSIHVLPSSFPPTRQGLHCSCCTVQLGHTKIFTWEQSPFIPAKLLLNRNKRRIYPRYSCYVSCQPGLLLVHPKQRVFSFQKTLDHTITKRSRVGQQASTHKFGQAKEQSPITHGALLGRNKASYQLGTTFVFASGRVKQVGALETCSVSHGREMSRPRSDLLTGLSTLTWEYLARAANRRLQITARANLCGGGRCWVPSVTSPSPQTRGLSFPRAAIVGGKMDLQGTTDNEAATTFSHPASPTASRSIACLYVHRHCHPPLTNYSSFRL